MRKLTAFANVTLDGYFTGPTGDFSWAHQGADDPEYAAFVADNAKGGDTLLFGRVTYQLMASWWPTPAARQSDPVVAERMNGLTKLVVSRTLTEVTWSNTTLLEGDLGTEVRRLKEGPGSHIAILGSGTVVAQLAALGLIDGYQLVVNPIALGNGRTLFAGLERALRLRLLESRAFRNGKVLLSYVPA